MKFSIAQSMLREIPLSVQIENSSLIVEGKVVKKKSFWNQEHSNIYTINTLEIHKVFKGDLLATIDVITLGGTVGFNSQIVVPNLILNNEDFGVFMLNEADASLLNISKSTNKMFKVYSSLQGFYKYDVKTDHVINPFSKKKDISNSFYNEITKYTKKSFSAMSNDVDIKSLQSKLNQTKNVLAPGSITFSPTTATAGTGALLTISGVGFGSSQGKVGFTNADDGAVTFANALDTQIKSWSNTRITVLIPHFAGTGKISVTDAASNETQSANSLTITYSQINGIFELPSNSGVYYSFPSRLVADDASGGYIWHMQTDFNNDIQHPGAKSDFLNAFNTWRCETGVNWTIGGASAVNVMANDGVNIIRFDNGNELDTGVLAQCVYYLKGCGTLSNFAVFAEELDIVFDDGDYWHFGSGLTGLLQYDFQSVALHELGHAHQLGHVIDNSIHLDNSNDVMQYAISNGEQQRVLKSTNINAANALQSINESATPACFSKSPMIAYNCSLSVSENELKETISVFPNPVRDKLFIENTSLITLKKAIIYDVNGRLLFEHDLSKSSKSNVIHVNYLSKGMYLIKIKSDTAETTKKILIY